MRQAVRVALTIVSLSSSVLPRRAQKHAAFAPGPWPTASRTSARLTASCRSIGTKAADTLLLEIVAIRPRSFSTRCRWRRGLDRIPWAGPRSGRAVRASSDSSASARRCSWCRRTTASAPLARPQPSSGPSPIHSRRPCCGAFPSKRPRAIASSSMPPRSSCAMLTAWPIACVRRSRAAIASKTREAPSTCRGRRAFPKNTEVEVTLTFVTTDPPGPLVSQVTPTPQAVTVREHHSLVELPPDGYAPRRSRSARRVHPADDLRLRVTDHGAAGDRWIQRHRLQKKDPAAPASPSPSSRSSTTSTTARRR